MLASPSMAGAPNNVSKRLRSGPKRVALRQFMSVYVWNCVTMTHIHCVYDDSDIDRCDLSHSIAQFNECQSSVIICSLCLRAILHYVCIMR